MTAFVHSEGKNSHDRISGRSHLSTLLQWDLNCQDTNFEGHIPIIHTVWIVDIPTSLLKKKKKKKTWSFSQLQRCISYFWQSLDMILQVLFPLGLLFSYTFLKFMKPHSGGVSLCHTGLWETFILPPPPAIVILGTFREAITCGCRSGYCPLFKAVKRNHTTLPQERKQISFLSNETKESELFISPRWLSPSKGQFIWLCGAQPSKCQSANGKGNLRYTLSCHHLQFFPCSPNNSHLFSLGQKVLEWVPYDSGFILSPVLVVFCGVYCTHKALIRPIL